MESGPPRDLADWDQTRIAGRRIVVFIAIQLGAEQIDDGSRKEGAFCVCLLTADGADVLGAQE